MKKITLGILLLFSSFLHAQISINGAATTGGAQTLLTPAQIVTNYLVGPGVTPNAVKFNGVWASPNSDQFGFWNTNINTTNLGFDKFSKGAILCTGKAIGALGPNTTSSFNLLPAIPFEGDADLALLSGHVIRNVAILEFDFMATGLELNFDYVFGSEEYPEYVNSSFNDVFGFFLSGPGINGPYSNMAENIALIPGTTTGVSINTVNNGPTGTGPCVNCAYYMGNNKQDTQYDGFTKVLRSSHALQSGGTYHIKLAIANASDNSYDSSLFLRNFTVQDKLKTATFIQDNIVLYPNPAKNQIQIGLQNSAENLNNIVIYDVLGNCVKKVDKFSSTQSTIDVSNLVKGIYLMEITTENQLKLTKKLVIE